MGTFACLAVVTLSFSTASYPPHGGFGGFGGFGGRGVHPNMTPHYGCFGYCHGPLNPVNPNRHWGCFGYCNGPLNPDRHWGCFGYCNGPLWGGGGYYPYWNPGISVIPEYMPFDPTSVYQGNINYNSTQYNAQGIPIVPTPKPVTSPDDPALAPYPVPSSTKYQPLEKWIEQLQSPSARLRGQAVETLGKMGPKAAGAVKALIPVLADKDAQVRFETTLTLAKIGKEALPAVVDALQDTNRMIVMGACLTLGHMDKGANTALVPLKKLLESSDPGIRGHAAQAMYRIDESTLPQVLPVLTGLLNTDDRNVRMGVLSAISQMGEPAAAAAPAVTKLLQDSDGQIKLAAAVCLANLTPKDTAFVPVLVAGLSDKNVAVRRDSALALSHAAVASLSAEGVVEPLAKALNDEDASVVHYAAVALSHLGAPAVPALTAALDSTKPGVKQYAMLALSQMGKDAAPATAKLKAIIQNSTDAETKFLAAEALMAAESK